MCSDTFISTSINFCSSLSYSSRLLEQLSWPTCTLLPVLLAKYISYMHNVLAGLRITVVHSREKKLRSSVVFVSRGVLLPSNSKLSTDGR